MYKKEVREWFDEHENDVSHMLQLSQTPHLPDTEGVRERERERERKSERGRGKTLHRTVSGRIFRLEDMSESFSYGKICIS